jgi:hypothetical protein
MTSADLAQNLTQFRAQAGQGRFGDDGDVTPGRREDDITKSKITLRDGLLLIVGAASMWGVQVGTQWGLRSEIREFIAEQRGTNAAQQATINEWRSETKLNREKQEAADNELSELKGFLAGIGIKGIPPKRKGQ